MTRDQKTLNSVISNPQITIHVGKKPFLQSFFSRSKITFSMGKQFQQATSSSSLPEVEKVTRKLRDLKNAVTHTLHQRCFDALP